MKPDYYAVIDATPHLLLRSDLCRAASDPEYTLGTPPVYIPEADFERASAQLSDPSRAVPFKPAEATEFFGMSRQHGLLYLPYPYLVPGGRFNSMYCWDTAFAIFAWTHEHPALMREQVDNQLYQIRVYGKVLNSNRTYHLSRSHPPMTAAMALHVFRVAQGRAWQEFDPDGLYESAEAWLAHALPLLQRYHDYWVTGDRLADGGPLSRYWDDSNLPAPEVVVGEPGHFDHAIEHFQARARTEAERADYALFSDPETGALTPLYYQADRAMRASGFDPTGHWGYGALRCIFHAPVCLNSLLYRMEGDLAEIAAALLLIGEEDMWKNRQAQRKAAMQKHMFNPERGIYEGYDFVRQMRNKDIFASIFHTLWAGLYDNPDEALRAATVALSMLETEHGITTSTHVSGSQWDHPYGWPPLQYFAIAGLQRYGHTEIAQRLALKYVELAKKIFAEQGTLFEKYNVRDGNSEVRVVNGYEDNTSEKGTFLWTAATLKMAEACLNHK